MGGGCISGAPNDDFLQNTLKTLFRLSRVLLDLQKCILSGATKFLSVRSSQGNLSLFAITRYYFSENLRCNLTFYESENFSDSSLHHILESENYRFPFSKKNRVTWVVKYEKLNFRKSQGIYQISFENCIRQWKVHLEIFIRPQAKENYTQYFLLRTNILRKTVVGCPWQIEVRLRNNYIYCSQKQERKVSPLKVNGKKKPQNISPTNCCWR